MSDTTTSDVDYTTPAELPDGDSAIERVAWHAQQARAAEAELAEVERLYDAELNRLVERRDNRARIIRERRDWHTAPIESYHRMLLAEHPKRKTLELPHATSRIRAASKPSVFITDDEAVTEWARANHPEIMRGPNVTALRSVVEAKGDDLVVVDPATGEVVPGVTAQIPDPKWSIDLEPGAPF